MYLIDTINRRLVRDRILLKMNNESNYRNVFFVLRGNNYFTSDPLSSFLYISDYFSVVLFSTQFFIFAWFTLLLITDRKEDTKQNKTRQFGTNSFFSYFNLKISVDILRNDHWCVILDNKTVLCSAEPIPSRIGNKTSSFQHNYMLWFSDIAVWH